MILKKNLKFTITFLFIFCALASAHSKVASAQDSVALSVTPPLIKNNMNPGERLPLVIPGERSEGRESRREKYGHDNNIKV